MEPEAKPISSPSPASAPIPPEKDLLQETVKATHRARGLRFRALLWALIGGIAAYALARAWHEFHFTDLAAALSRIGPGHLLLAAIFTVASYLCGSWLGVMAQQWLGHPAAKTGNAVANNFIVTAFTMNAGGSLMGGGSIRLRFSAEQGLSAAEAGKVVLFTWLAGWGGHLLLCGILLALSPPEMAWLDKDTLRHLGVGLLILGLSLPWLGSFIRKGWPRPRLALLSLFVSTLDWLFAGLALWALFPDLSLSAAWSLIALLIVAQAMAALSHVPGGLGVLELIMTKGLAGIIAGPILASGLLLYRLIYYLLPFGVSLFMLMGRTLTAQRSELQMGTRWARRGWSMLAPRLACILALAGGFILLLSGNIPMEAGRRGLVAWFPLPFVEASHFIASLTGALLIVLAWGLRRRVQAAWTLSVIAMCGGIVFSLLKGLDWEEALALGFALVCLWSSRRHFHRHAAIWTYRYTLSWWLLISGLVGVSLWAGFFSSRHVPYENDLWWRFTLDGDASRFLRAATGASCVLLLAALAQLLRPARPRSPATTAPALVDNLVATSEHADAALAWLGDKSFLIGAGGKSGLMYAEQGRSRICLGELMGETEDDDLPWRFVERARDEGMVPVFYQVSVREMPRLVDMGFNLYKIGETAEVELANFNLEGGNAKRLRQTRVRFQKQGLCFAVWERPAVEARLQELRVVSDAWLMKHQAGEKGFSIGRFEPDYVRRFRCAVVSDNNGHIVAFATVLESAQKKELSVDLMRQLPLAPTGVMEALFIELLLWGRSQNYQTFSLGMAPLSGLSNHPLAPLWHQVATRFFHRGGALYNFQGLRGFKEKFHPTWVPSYIAVPSIWSLPSALFDVTILVGGGLRRTLGIKTSSSKSRVEDRSNP